MFKWHWYCNQPQMFPRGAICLTAPTRVLKRTTNGQEVIKISLVSCLCFPIAARGPLQLSSPCLEERFFFFCFDCLLCCFLLCAYTAGLAESTTRAFTVSTGYRPSLYYNHHTTTTTTTQLPPPPHNQTRAQPCLVSGGNGRKRVNDVSGCRAGQDLCWR